MEHVELSSHMGHLSLGSLHAQMCELPTESVGKEGKKIEKERRKYG